jgi:hypothetical protein
MKRSQDKVPFYVLLTVVGMGLRLGIEFLLWRSGYFYGKEYDTYVRAALSWHWSIGYYAGFDYYWPPLQFWIVGTAYKLIIPITKTVELWVPVAINHIFFAGSLALTSYTANLIGGKKAAMIAALLSVTMAGDIWATFSALSEPMTIFFTSGTSLTVLLWVQSWGQVNRQKMLAALLGVWVGLAAITHFMGWFFSILMAVGVAMVSLFRLFALRKEGKILTLKRCLDEIGVYLIAVMIAWLPVFYWTFINWQQHGNPVHFLNTASSVQLHYAKLKPIIYRALSPSLVLWQYAPILFSLASISIPFVVRKYGRIWMAYLAPTALHFIILTISGALALSASYQEPRYLVIYVWVIVPFVASWCGYLIDDFTRFRRIVGWGLLIFITAASLWQAFHFTNSFSVDVKNVSFFARQWFRSHPNMKLVIEDDWAAEEIVIPMVSGYPGNFIHAKKQELISICEGMETISTIPRNTIWILSTDTFHLVDQKVGLIERIGPYRLVSPCKR